MKKTLYALLMCSVSVAPALAQTDVEQSILDLIEQKVLPKEVSYETPVSIKTTAAGYVVNIPQGTLKTDKKTKVPAYVFVLSKEAPFKDAAQYQFTLNSLESYSPALKQILDTQNVRLESFTYQGKIVPSLKLITSQMGQGKNLVFQAGPQVDDIIRVGSFLVQDTLDSLSGNLVKAEGDIVLKDVLINHPFLRIAMDQLDTQIFIPQTTLGTTDLDQVLNAPEIRLGIDMTGIKAASFFLPVQELRLDSAFGITLKQDMSTKVVDMNIDWKASNIAAISPETEFVSKLPTSLIFDMNMKGFTYADLQSLGQSQNHLNEARSVPFTRPEALRVLENEVQTKTNELMAKTSFFLNNLSLRGNDYAVALRGAVYPQSEAFTGTLTITNFDALSPAPKAIDTQACQTATEAWSRALIQKSGNESDPEVRKASAAASAACDDGAGFLEFLRPYLATAKQVKDEMDKPAVQFAVEYKNGVWYINGKELGFDTETQNDVSDTTAQKKPLIP